MAVINKVVVKGQSYDIEDAITKKGLSTEVTRATEAETELLARLQGTSENSNAANDPFKRLPKVSDVTELMTVLDAMHGSSANSAYNGRFRVLVGTQDVDIYNYVLGYQYDTWVQEIRSPYELCQTYTDKATSLPNNDYYLARKYNQELRMVSSVDYRGGTRTLRRMHNVDKWTNWVDTTNPYINSPLYGKNILLLGGSFAHNTRAAGTSNSGYGFTLLGREYSLQNYVAQELGLSRLDNYAISGNGSCISNFTYNTFAQLEAAIAYAEEQGYTYDGIVLVGGVNDYMKSSPLGSLKDGVDDNSFYAGIKKVIKRARTKYPAVKLFMTTPFKGFNDAPYYNPTSTVTNDAGHRYYEYVQALKEIAHYASIPLLDIYSIHQVDTNNYGRYTRSSADDVLHPNGLGYQNIALPLIEFLAWGKGAATFNNEALQVNLKEELGEQIEDNASKILQNTGNIDKLGESINNKETELLARIQGTSDASNAMKDPFKFVGNYNTATLDNFRAWLDSLHGTDYTLDNRGVYRVVLNDAVIEIISSPIEYTKERYNQVVKGRVSIESTTGLITSSSEFNLLERTHNIDNGWSAWRVVANADTLDTLNNAITAETARAEKAETFLTPVPNTYWRLEAVGKTSSLYSNTGYKSIIVPVREGDKFVITAEGDGYARTWGTLDENKVLLRYAEGFPQTNAEVTIAAEECYLVVNCETAMLWDVRIASTAADILQHFIAVENRATEKGRQLALRDIFIAAGALYNDTAAPITRNAPWGESVQHLAGHYYLNGLGDITEEQMMAIYNVGNRGLRELAYASELTRTFITTLAGSISYAFESSLRGCFYACRHVETLGDNSESLYIKSSMEGFFRNCSKLKYINFKHILLRYATSVNNVFGGCAALVRVKVREIAKSISFADSQFISKESILYMIVNAIPTSAITVTLHPDAYARLAEDSEIVEALEAQPLVTLVSA